MIAQLEVSKLELQLAALGMHGARLRSIVGHLLKLYDLAGAIAWIKAPQPLLAGKVPAEMMQTERGAQLVEALLEAAASGAYL